MKIVVSIAREEKAAIDDVFGTFGSEIRVKEFAKNGKLDATVKGAHTPFGGFVGIITIPDWVMLGIAQIAMSHKNTINGLVKAIDGVCQMADGLIKGIRKDFKKMVEDHYNK